MKLFFVAFVGLLSFSAQSLIAQSELGGSLIANFTTGTPSYGDKYSIITDKGNAGFFKSSTGVEGNGVDNHLLRDRVLVTGNSSLDLLICPNNIIARREHAGRTIHLKNEDGGVISLAVPRALANSSSAEWCISCIQQLLALQDSDHHNAKISIIGIDDKLIEVPNKSDSIKPIDIFKIKDEMTGVVSYSFSYVATAVGATSMTFVLVESGVDGDIVKDTASFTIQVDDDDADVAAPISISSGFSIQPPSSAL